MHKTNYRVCALIVTYNRKKLLLRNIKTLLKQKYPLDIFIFDNNSNDGTYDFLKENHMFDKKNVIYFKSKNNLGGAGGFSMGSKKIIEKGYDFVWMMDDDGYCINDMVLNNLISIYDNNKKIILNAYVINDVKTLEPTFKLHNCNSFQELKNFIYCKSLIEGGSPYNGTLVPRQCFLDIGYPDERFFIYGDEYEFYLRSKKNGYVWITNLNSLYYHPVNRNIIKTIKIFNKKIECLDQPIWKFYLDVRNTTYINKKYYSKVKISSYIKIILICLLSNKNKIKRLKYGFMGIKDGKNDFFDRPIMFNI